MQVAMEVAGQSKKWQFLPIRSVVDEREGERERESNEKIFAEIPFDRYAF